MKTRTNITLGALCAVVWLAVPAPRAAVAGPNPQQIADHCIAEVGNAAQQRMHRNRNVAAQCVRMIDILLAFGHNGAAQALALNCIHDVVAGSQQTVTNIQQQSAHCIQMLLALGAPKLAEEVDKASRLAVQAVNHSRQGAVNSIKFALQGGPSTGATVTN